MGIEVNEHVKCQIGWCVVSISDFQAAHKESINGQMTVSTNALRM